jgi:hypothetical protein
MVPFRVKKHRGKIFAKIMGIFIIIEMFDWVGLEGMSN